MINKQAKNGNVCVQHSADVIILFLTETDSITSSVLLHCCCCVVVVQFERECRRYKNWYRLSATATVVVISLANVSGWTVFEAVAFNLYSFSNNFNGHFAASFEH